MTRIEAKPLEDVTYEQFKEFLDSLDEERKTWSLDLQGYFKTDKEFYEVKKDVLSFQNPLNSKSGNDDKTNEIYIYYPNIKNEEDLLRSLVHEYTHYRQDHSLFQKYRDMYDYDDPENKIEAEARKAEEDWYLFSQR